MSEMLMTSAFFGVTVSLLTYMLGLWLKKKFKFAFLNPLLIAIVPVSYTHLRAHETAT